MLTVKDAPVNESIIRFGQIHTIGGGFESLYRVLADKNVHFIGEAVALVGAEKEEITEKALGLTYVGGGFGEKSDVTVESFVALLTYTTGQIYV